jgi:hypothetical protein
MRRASQCFARAVCPMSKGVLGMGREWAENGQSVVSKRRNGLVHGPIVSSTAAAFVSTRRGRQATPRQCPSPSLKVISFGMVYHLFARQIIWESYALQPFCHVQRQKLGLHICKRPTNLGCCSCCVGWSQPPSVSARHAGLRRPVCRTGQCHRL